jgi:hypothetical protein
MRYALLICADENAALSLTPEERSARFDAFTAFSDAMTARGVLLGGERLRPSSTASTVQVRNGGVVIADGPFAETKEQPGGFYLIEARDRNEAIRLASEMPPARVGSIEERPLEEVESR